jgi:hypothetical protein
MDRKKTVVKEGQQAIEELVHGSSDTRNPNTKITSDPRILATSVFYRVKPEAVVLATFGFPTLSLSPVALQG